MNMLFRTKFLNLATFQAFFYILFGIICIYHIAIKNFDNNKIESILAIFLFSIFIIQGIRIAKTFILYEEKLVVRRPLTFTNKTDITILIHEINEIVLKKNKGRYGGPFISIRTKNGDRFYRINSDAFEIADFINNLEKLNVIIKYENWNKS